MKNRYERMTKEERRDLYSKYKQDKSEFVKKMNRMFILCYLGIFYSVCVFVYDFFFKNSTANSILDIVVLLFCVFALLKIFSVRKELLNTYALNKDKEIKKNIVKKHK